MAMTKGHRIKRFTRKRRNHRTSLMFQALEEGNVLMMKQLLKDGGLKINARLAETEITLLHLSVFSKCCIVRTIIRRLVQAGCRINAATPKGDTALHLAVRYHKIYAAVELIRLGANVRAKNNLGETPLQIAVVNKTHYNLLEDAIPNGERYRQMNFIGMESLRMAIAPGRERSWMQYLTSQGMVIKACHSLVKMLLDAGADVNARDVNDCSPLHCAVYTGDLELVKTIIDAGADLNHLNESGATALHDAVLCCNEKMVHLLLSRGAHVDTKDLHHGDTALHWAVQLNIDKSHEGIIKTLMKFGSDPNRENTIDETPFNYALQFGDVDLVTFFINEYKADINKLASDGKNALAFAAQNEHKQVMDLVLNAGLQVNHRCKEGLTPLHHASEMSLLENVRQLICRGAHVNARGDLDRTPLFHCVIQPHVYVHGMTEIPMTFLRTNLTEDRRRVIRLLLESGADVNHLADTFEMTKATILELAIALEEIEVAKVIIEYAAEVEARTKKPLFDEHNLRVINQNPKIESYYQMCRAELTAMRTAKIEGSLVSYLSVLLNQLDVVARYARNSELVDNFQFNLQNDYPIYESQLREKFNAAIAKQKAFKEASTVLSTTLQFADPSHVAFEKILGFLSEADIKLLIGRGISPRKMK